MANIIFKYKGKNDLNLTREFNSTPAFVANKDDVKFNDTSNPFSDYLASSSCGSWTDDKIKILSLPHKGRLFYLTNPGGGTAVYANVTVGQEIVVRDMTDNKVLKFSAEGSSDGQHTGNYFTEFTFERYCATTPSNVVSTVKLNMIDTQVAISNIYVTDVIPDSSAGTTSYKLHVENEPWTGIVKKQAMKNLNAKNAYFDSAHGDRLYIPAENDMTEYVENEKIETIQIGVYNCVLTLIGAANSMYEDVEITGSLYYGNNIGVDVYKFIQAYSDPETP